MIDINELGLGLLSPNLREEDRAPLIEALIWIREALIMLEVAESEAYQSDRPAIAQQCRELIDQVEP